MTKRRPERPQRHARSTAELRRSAPSKAARALILIVCEGEQTEYRYFDAIRREGNLVTVSVELEPDARQALKLVQHACKLRHLRRRQSEALPYDEIWCVFDREAGNEPASFEQAVALAEREGLRLVISNPAFEYWYLLHFRETNRPYYDAGGLLDDLRRHLPLYEKKYEQYTQLRERTRDAIERAERLYDGHPDREHDRYPNPSTLVQRLVRRLLMTE
ncbi:MAG: RloB domain-containing protein [Blastochloris sp.]|nr:RloB domain-containing protein [Blastochloris sp.]